MFENTSYTSQGVFYTDMSYITIVLSLRVHHLFFLCENIKYSPQPVFYTGVRNTYFCIGFTARGTANISL